MPIRVLVVDDSGFFRRRVSEILNDDVRLEVIGTAVDGRDAIRKVAELRPDVVTMDIEMPVMDGISAVRRIMASPWRVPVLMFSSLTTDGAQTTLDALDAGAIDYMPKKFEDVSRDRKEAQQQLCDKVVLVGRSRVTRPEVRATSTESDVSTRSLRRSVAPSVPTDGAAGPVSAEKRRTFRVVVIGASTGGPVALQEVLSKLPANFPLPLLLVQHMPASFTPAFAQRLDQKCAISVREAKDGELLQPGVALLAPGGRQLMVENRGRVRILDGDPSLHYRPSVDVAFGSVAKAYPGQALGIVLTGMGADGREGARLMKMSGSPIWAQDEASSVVYGMPAAVADAGLAEHILPLGEVGGALTRRLM